jgi:hypothetical protein
VTLQLIFFDGEEAFVQWLVFSLRWLLLVVLFACMSA